MKTTRHLRTLAIVITLAGLLLGSLPAQASSSLYFHNVAQDYMKDPAYSSNDPIWRMYWYPYYKGASILTNLGTMGLLWNWVPLTAVGNNGWLSGSNYVKKDNTWYYVTASMARFNWNGSAATWITYPLASGQYAWVSYSAYKLTGSTWIFMGGGNNVLKFNDYGGN